MKPLPVDLSVAERAIVEERVRRARILGAHDPHHLVLVLERAVSLVDCSRTARATGNHDAAEGYLDRARCLLIDLVGIKP